ncbi:hypothetical protein ANCCAN_11925 [Ancylostoma caninum]|uniref:Uncharacterized protein n=1 Tax=Ancylostoma caninum TaxID=29170 RepID=A0A368GCP9_ANCCA|nr:hypothetical protein ANCCAN_11925 [Ancylostoma caninum]
MSSSERPTFQLFRDLIKRSCCSNSARKQRAEKIRKAEARVIATRALAEKPNSFLLGQVMVMSNLASNKVRLLYFFHFFHELQCEKRNLISREYTGGYWRIPVSLLFP